MRQEPTMTGTHARLGAAHDAYLRRALDSVRWERRGLLRRLVRVR
jgi:hypothetical protein